MVKSKVRVVLLPGEAVRSRLEPPMSMKRLIEKLKDCPKTVNDHRDEQKKEWLDALDVLYKLIDGWLKDAVAAGVVTTARSRTEVNEQDFGAYQVPVLEIRAGERTVRLEPIGVRVTGIVYAGSRRMLGLKGRVDLVCGPIKNPPGANRIGPLEGVARARRAVRTDRGELFGGPRRSAS